MHCWEEGTGSHSEVIAYNNKVCYLLPWVVGGSGPPMGSEVVVVLPLAAKEALVKVCYLLLLLLYSEDSKNILMFIKNQHND